VFHRAIVINGYYVNIKETTTTIDGEGWLHIEDVGYDGKYYNFYIVDRLKEIIKYKG